MIESTESAEQTAGVPLSCCAIIPTTEEARGLRRVLGSLNAQTERRFETLVVRNGQARSQSAEAEITALYPELGVRVIDEPVAGLLAGRHRGLRESTAEIVVFLDDDVEVAPRWMESIAANFTEPDVQLVGGPSVPEYESAPPAWLDQFIYREDGSSWCSYLSLTDSGPERVDIDPGRIWGLNFAIRRSALVATGGFHPDGVPWRLRRFRGDGETAVSDATKRLGLRAVYDPVMTVTHIVPANRLTMDYFRRRGHLQGISDSYSHLRQRHLHHVPPRSMQPVSLRRRFKGWVRAILRREEAADALSSVDACYRAGYQYHQREFKRDPLLREWVLRENYWDYSYPDCTEESHCQ